MVQIGGGIKCSHSDIQSLVSASNINIDRRNSE